GKRPEKERSSPEREDADEYNLFRLFSACGDRDIADSLVFGRFILVNKYPEIHEYLTNFFSREIFIMLFPQIMRKTRTQREQTVGSA
nr:hypothetical protein [Candidatus Sigynarchaeota archaeon]